MPPKSEALGPFDAAFKRRQASWRQWPECFGKDRLVVCLMGNQAVREWLDGKRMEDVLRQVVREEFEAQRKK